MRTRLAFVASLGLAALMGSAAAASPAACAPAPAEPEMVALPGGRVTLGAAAMRREEGPPREARVAPFSIGRTHVTNAQFAAFVAATEYVTAAEKGDHPASLVFTGARGPVDPDDPSGWWAVVEGADWRHPKGPGSSIEGLEAHPVVHVAYEDALAYARWRGEDLPTEAEWEYAARGGLDGARYPWGDEPPTAGAPRANVWQGLFPIEDRGEDGYAASTSPVGCYPANGFGLYDMAGNAWQWTQDAFDADTRVIKGGSFLCAENFCFRYRPAARTGATPADGASHIGFRTVRRMTDNKGDGR